MTSERYNRRDVLALSTTIGAGLFLGGSSGGAFAQTPSGRSPTPVDRIPRTVPEGSVPLIAVEGTAYECGQHYAEIVQREYPGYRQYLSHAPSWESISGNAKKLFEQRAPYVLDVCRGMADASAPDREITESPQESGCTSFGVSGSLTLDGGPISGQNKDTALASAKLYIVLRMRIKQGPTILVLAYPGELLGYGMWSTGMSLFRNGLYSTASAETGLTFEQWGLLALAGKSAREAAELANEYGIASNGNCLITDTDGEALSVECNVGGVSVVPAKDGIATHANHPVGKTTAPFEDYPDAVEKENSRYRMNGLWKLLNAERGCLTAQKAMMALADHTKYPRGLCRHIVGGKRNKGTTAAIVAEPAKGKLHVVRGNPCSNWPTTYTF